MQIAYVQMMTVLRQLPVSKNVLRKGLAVVREIEQVDKVGFLLLNRFPAEVNNVLQSDRLPTICSKCRSYRQNIKIGI